MNNRGCCQNVSRYTSVATKWYDDGSTDEIRTNATAMADIIKVMPLAQQTDIKTQPCVVLLFQMSIIHI